MATFPLDHRTRLWMEDGALVSNTAGPKQTKKAWCAYVDIILSTQCIHVIFMDVMQFIYSTVFLSFFLFPHNILREGPAFWGFLSIAISYIFLN